MPLYVESSAVLMWMLGQARAAEIEKLIDSADWIFSSDLTLIEADRALIRAQSLGQFSSAEAIELSSRMADVSLTWDIVGFSPGIVRRARRPFPAEPIRALDALHVASAMAVRESVPDIEILSLHDRIRRVAEAMGFPVRP